MPDSLSKLVAGWGHDLDCVLGMDSGPDRCKLCAVLRWRDEWTADIRKAQKSNKAAMSLGPLHATGIAQAQAFILESLLGVEEPDAR